MNRRFGQYLVLLAAAACLLAPPASAQNPASSPSFEPKLKALPKGGPAPRNKEGHPDLSGVWFPGTTGGFDVSEPAAQRQFDPKVTPEERPSFQPWAAEKIKGMTEVDLELKRASVNCEPRGVPGMFTINPYPLKFVQTATELIQLNELNNNWRVIPIDGRKHDPDPDPTFNGDSVGRWEGDTLVIETIAIDERTWNDFVGWFHSDQERVIERISRPSENYLIYQVTIEDPKVLTKPWTSATRQWTLSHDKLDEYYCTNNREPEQYQLLKEQQERQGK